MGDWTFFKVEGGTSARQKNYKIVLWFQMANMPSQALKYDVIAIHHVKVLITLF